MTREEFDIGLELLKGEGVTLDLLSGLTKVVDEYIKTLEATIEAQEIIIKAMAQPKTCEGCKHKDKIPLQGVWMQCGICTRNSIIIADYYEPKAQP